MNKKTNLLDRISQHFLFLEVMVGIYQAGQDYGLSICKCGHAISLIDYKMNHTMLTRCMCGKCSPGCEQNLL